MSPRRKERWSQLFSFRLLPDAMVWDRSGWEDLLDDPPPHPRLFFNAATLASVIDLRFENEESARVFERLAEVAEQTLESDWYLSFPRHDCPPGSDPRDLECSYTDLNYKQMGKDLAGLEKTT